ncbi:MAG: hypothetical protein M1834_004984 [Cirrosporium novae-zelandiae]|nr:MAG: hypothetical protein M1834_004984 [Cirrosporium novae-zelandiae]
MAPTQFKKRKLDSSVAGRKSRPSKKSRRQLAYHSSSDEDSKPANLEDFEGENNTNDDDEPELDIDSRSESQSQPEDENDGDVSDAASEVTNNSSASSDSEQHSKKKKRNDPDAFATSMSKILGSKLSSSKRSDPVLARSKDAAEANQEISNSRLEAKARRKLRDEKRTELDRGRVKDVLGLEAAGKGGNQEISVGETLELERKLRKSATKGVVRLFNAFRAAQVKAEEAAKAARTSSMVGMNKREEEINKMSKEGFLDLINGTGSKKGKSKTTEGA